MAPLNRTTASENSSLKGNRGIWLSLQRSEMFIAFDAAQKRLRSGRSETYLWLAADLRTHFAPIGARFFFWVAGGYKHLAPLGRNDNQGSVALPG
jgi:hypothetical protein